MCPNFSTSRDIQSVIQLLINLSRDTREDKKIAFQWQDSAKFKIQLGAIGNIKKRKGKEIRKSEITNKQKWKWLNEIIGRESDAEWQSEMVVESGLK